ncbi:MAG: hypothetical protein Marn2KO_36210 [Marinobacter nauticus]
MVTDTMQRKNMAYLAMFLVVFAAFCVWVQPKGLYVIDEAVQTLVTHELVDHDGSRRLHNDLDLNDLEAYRPTSVRLVNKEWLAPQYPPLYADFAAPFYWAFGVDGLFYMNNFAFLLNLLLVYLIGRRLSLEHSWSLVAVGIYGACSFAIDQAFSAWSHTPSVTGVLAGHYGIIHALTTDRRKVRIIAAFLAGMAVSLAVGIRIEMGLALPVLLAVLLFGRPVRWDAIVAFVLGAAGPLVWITMINCGRFDYCNPIAYGPQDLRRGLLDITYYLPVAGTGMLGLAAIWGLARPGAAEYRKYAWVGGPVILLVAVVVAAIIMPALLDRTLTGIRTVFLDVPAFDISQREASLDANGEAIYHIGSAVLASPTGQLLYYGQYKKALLQSLPWLPLALPALLPMIGGARRWPYMAALLLMPVAAIAMFGYANWHGGIGPNMRYLSIVAPLAAVPVAVSLRWLFARQEGEKELWGRIRLAIYAGLMALSLAMIAGTWPVTRRELAILVLPLVLSAVLLGALVLAWRTGMLTVARIMVGVTLAWGMGSGLFRDYGTIFFYRLSGHHAAEAISSALEPKAVIIMVSAEGYFLRTVAQGMVEHDATLVQPEKKGAKGFETVLTRYQDSDRPLFMAMPEEFITIYQDRGLLDGWTLEPTETEPKLWRLQRVEAP